MAKVGIMSDINGVPWRIKRTLDAHNPDGSTEAWVWIEIDPPRPDGDGGEPLPEPRAVGE